METVITKKLKVSKMHKIFDAQHDDFMVKYFKPKNKNITERIEMHDTIVFEILVRHNDEMDAKELFNKALKTDLKTFNIESRVTRIECTSVKAKTRKEALKIAENNKSLKWDQTHEEERQLVSIS